MSANFRFETIPLIDETLGATQGGFEAEGVLFEEEFNGFGRETGTYELPAGEYETASFLEWETPARPLQRNQPKPPGLGTGGAPAPAVIPGSMPAIFFKLKSTDLRHDSQDDSLIHLMSAVARIHQHIAQARRAGRTPQIILHGFASAEGNPTFNKILSKKRAERIKELLLAAKIGGVITTVGHGADNTFPDRSFNRRVAFELK